MPQFDEAVPRFWAQVRKSSECWIWLGVVHKSRGRFSWKGKDWSAHRAAWVMSGRRVPAGATLVRACGMLLCVRPDHMKVSRPPALARAVRNANLRRAFWERVEKRRRGCWPWRGIIMTDGRGYLVVKRRYLPATRVAWTLAHGPFPPEKIIQHLCGNRGCVRPEHLRLADKSDALGKPEDRLWGRVKKTRDCWLWQGSHLEAGNGVIGWKGRTRLVERIVWQLERGPIPPGKKVLHECFNSACVRPDHLLLGTSADLQHLLLRKGRHWSQVKPEAHLRGDAHPMRRNPELALRGEEHPRAKLTDEGVRDIRRRHAHGASQKGLAREYGVHRTNIRFVVRRLTWKHIR